jgi:hypothetical protein
VLAAAALALYIDRGFSWLALLILWLAPDLGAVGYLAGNRVGAIAYDLTHFEGWPVALATFGVVADAKIAVQLALIWLSHIGIDRAIGYGLKYPSAFKDTHIQRV